MQDNMIKEMTEIYKALEPIPTRKTQKFKTRPRKRNGHFWGADTSYGWKCMPSSNDT